MIHRMAATAAVILTSCLLAGATMLAVGAIDGVSGSSPAAQTAQASTAAFPAPGPRLSRWRCRQTTRGRLGSDNDIRRAKRGIKGIRWSWGHFTRVDNGHVVQSVRFNYAAGGYSYVYFWCRWEAGYPAGVNDQQFFPG
jgi:hypothetical protein